MSKRLIAFAPLGVLLVIVLALLSLLVKGQGEADDPMVGQPFPALQLEPLDGYPAFDTLDGLPGDGPVLVNLWASWCTPCLVEHPLLMAMHEEGVPIYGIDYKEREAGAGEAFLARHGSPFTAVGADPEGRAGLELGLTGVPETYVVDSDGEIIARHAGALDETVLREKILPALRRAEAG